MEHSKWVEVTGRRTPHRVSYSAVSPALGGGHCHQGDSRGGALSQRCWWGLDSALGMGGGPALQGTYSEQRLEPGGVGGSQQTWGPSPLGESPGMPTPHLAIIGNEEAGSRSLLSMGPSKSTCGLEIKGCPPPPRPHPSHVTQPPPQNSHPSHSGRRWASRCGQWRPRR